MQDLTSNSLYIAMRAALNKQGKSPVTSRMAILSTTRMFFAEHLLECEVSTDSHLANSVIQTPELDESTTRRKFCLLLGGGIDSTLLLYYMIQALKIRTEDIVVLHVSYGAPYEKKEVAAVIEIKATANFRLGQALRFQHVRFSHKIAENSRIKEDTLVNGYVIPFRNLFLASVAANFGDTIFVAANWRAQTPKGSTTDKDGAFFCRATHMLSSIHGTPKLVMSPFLHMSKADSIYWMLEAFGFEATSMVIRDTVSCYSGSGKRCGRCFSCYKAYNVFSKFGFTALQRSFDNNPQTDPNLSLYNEREALKGR